MQWHVVPPLLLTPSVLKFLCGFSVIINLFFLFVALATSLIGTIGIGDGGNEIGMGKVLDSVKEHIPYGEKIACRIGADQLITAGVSNWGGYALATSLYILQYCPVHSRYLRRGIGEYRPLALDKFVNSNDQVRGWIRLLKQYGIKSGRNSNAAALGKFGHVW